MAHFQGPRTLKRTIRPPRVVYVVQTIEHCDAALQKCSVTWGGKQFCIVPYSPEYGFSEDWLKLIARYDPDSILTFPVLSAAAIDQLSEHAVFKISDLIDDERKGYAGPRSLLAASEQLLAVGQSIYAALASMDPPATGLKFRDVVIPHPNSEYEWRRYERAAFGYFDETTGHLAELFRREELRQDLRLKDIINVSYLEQDHDFIHHSIETSLASDKLSLIDYTLMQLSPQVSGRSLLQIGDRSIVHDEQNLLFVSDGISIDDFCWFWCLRSQRYPPPSWLPLWLPIELFEQHANTIRKRLPPRDRTFLISCSVNQTDLGKLAAKLNRNVEPTSSELYRFFDDISSWWVLRTSVMSFLTEVRPPFQFHDPMWCKVCEISMDFTTWM